MNAIKMIAACGAHQVGEGASPSLGTPRTEPDPVNHDSLSAVADHGVDGHATTEQGIDDLLVPPRPEPQAVYA